MPHSIKLILETDEWDPIGGAEEEEGWSVSEDESDEERKLSGREKGRDGSRWKRREMEIPAGTRMVGFFVEGARARVRVVLK